MVDVVVTTSSDLVGPFRIADARTANGDQIEIAAPETARELHEVGFEAHRRASALAGQHSTRSLFAPTPTTVITPASVRRAAHPAESGRHSAIGL